jgi:hypothetical protein
VPIEKERESEAKTREMGFCRKWRGGREKAEWRERLDRQLSLDLRGLCRLRRRGRVK